MEIISRVESVPVLTERRMTGERFREVVMEIVAYELLRIDIIKAE